MLKEIADQPDLRRADASCCRKWLTVPAAALGLNVVSAPAFRLGPDFVEGLAILSRYRLGAETVLPLPSDKLHFHTRIRIGLIVVPTAPGARSTIRGHA